jgi:hypothetical protein
MKTDKGWAWRYTPTFPATWLLRRQVEENHGLRPPGKKHKTLSEKQIKSKQTGDLAQVAEHLHLPRCMKGPEFNPQYCKKKRRKHKRVCLSVSLYLFKCRDCIWLICCSVSKLWTEPAILDCMMSEQIDESTKPQSSSDFLHK